ncbi:MAG: aquaporin family protein [Bacteroidetes bacterium]|nr:MAG: aquaporin family protein [Bacteroidota bacterium]
MHELIAEFIGTFLLILLGNGVVANVVLRDTKGNNGGWIVISLGWGLGVFVGVAVAGPVSGAHINPAVTVGLAAAGLFPWSKVVVFIVAQMAGAATGATMVWLYYRHHFNRTDDPAKQLACYCTTPAIRKFGNNFISETTGTFVLIFVVLYIAEPALTLGGNIEVKLGLGTLGALPVSLLVTAIGLSLGGTTGYAINPARDLAPRIMHSVLPMMHKGKSDWSYSWIPVAGPVTGALLAAFLYMILQKTVI